MACIDCGHMCRESNCYTCTYRGCPRMAGAATVAHRTPAYEQELREWAQRRLVYNEKRYFETLDAGVV